MFPKIKKDKKEYALVIKDYEWLNIINTNKIYDFAIYKDTLIITISQYLLFFVQNNDFFEISKSIKLEKQLHRIDTFEDYLVGFSSDLYVSFQGMPKVNTYYFVLDFISYRSKFKILNNPKGLLLSLLQPRYLINSYNNKIVVIDAIGDSILFSIYDCFQDKIINKFSYKPNTWVPPNYDDIISLEKNLNQDSLKYPKKIIDIIRPNLQKFSTISKVDFINDSTLLVYRSHPKSNYQDSYDLHYFFDIIKINNDSLKIIENLHNMNFKNEKSLKYHRNSWHVRNSYILTGKYLLLIEPIPFEFDNSLFELSINQLREKIENYCSQGNKIRYSIVILIYKDDE